MFFSFPKAPSVEQLRIWSMLAVLMICGFYIRIGSWSDYYLSTDDLWHLVIAKHRTVMDVIRASLAEEVHPPLSFILLHFMLEISDNPYFLRCISLVPGMLLIPMAYLLGKERLGVIAGIAMAFVITFGELTVTQSWTIRAYSLALLCIVFALWAMYRFDKTRNGWLVGGYFMAMLIAVELVHSMAFFIFATGSLWFLKYFRDKNAWKFLVIWVVGHIFLAGCLLSYIYLLNFKLSISYFVSLDTRTTVDLAAFYTTKLLQYLLEASSTTNPLLLIVTLTAFVSGFYCCITTRLWDILYLFLSIWLACMIADYFLFFPLSIYSRNTIFIIIPVSLIIGSSIKICHQAIIAHNPVVMQHKNIPIGDIRKNKNINFWVAIRIFLSRNNILPTSKLMASRTFIMVIFIISCIFITYSIAASDFMRGTRPGTLESSIKTKNVAETLAKLTKFVQPGDIIITSSQTSWVLRYLLDLPPIIHPNPYVAELKHWKAPVYFDGRPSRSYNIFNSPFDLQKFFIYLQSVIDLSKIHTIWFLHIGWNDDIIGRAMQPAFTPPVFGEFCLKNEPLCDVETYNYRMESYYFSWKLFLSNDVYSRFIAYDHRGSAVSYAVTPEFIQRVIIGGHFSNGEEIYKERVSYLWKGRMKSR